MPDRPLVVGINAQLRSGEHGGIEQFVVGLASALSDLTDGDEQYLFLVEPGEDAWLRPHVHGRARVISRLDRRSRLVRAAWAARRRLVRTLPWLRRLRRPRAPAPAAPPVGPGVPASDGTLEAAGADLVHFPFQAGFLTGLASVYQPWDLQHLHLPEFFTPEAVARREHEYRALCDSAARVVVASDWAKRDLVTRYGLDSGKVVVIPVPSPIEAYPEPRPAELDRTAERLKLPSRFALYPAQTWEHKNHLRLLQALAEVRDRHGTVVPLVCSGRLTERFCEIEREVERLGLLDSVRFVGFVSPIEIRALYRLARLLVFPSLFEGWGFPVVEALSEGVPVACARVTSLPDVVGDAAVLFDPRDISDMADAIHRAWADDALRAELTRRGRYRVEDLDWPRCARRFRDAYRAAAGRDASPSDPPAPASPGASGR